jgi:hypothetical protein
MEYTNFNNESASQDLILLEKLRQANQNFNYDWNTHVMAGENQNFDEQAKQLVSFITIIQQGVHNLHAEEQTELAKLCYKIATFYLHKKRNPEPALSLLEIAKLYLIGKDQQWAINQLSFVYQQRSFAKNDTVNSINNAYRLSDSIIASYPDIGAINDVEVAKIVGFAYCIKALTYYEDKQLDAAADTYQIGIELYKRHGLEDIQTMRATTRCAQMIFEQAKAAFKTEDAELAAAYLAKADTMFSQLLALWESILSRYPLLTNDYPARFFQAYGDYLADKARFTHDKQQGELAVPYYQRAYEILATVEGEDSRFTQIAAEKMRTLQTELTLPPFVSANVASGWFPESKERVATFVPAEFPVPSALRHP